MVNNSSSSLSQGNLNDAEKRRKYSIERAKATHLSRQLQMRLQYARLKVEHGWQKQNLNEVENLYFHHSHQRGPKPYPSPQLLATTTQPSETGSFTTSLSTQSKSSLSFKLGSYNLAHTSDPPTPSSSSNSRPTFPTSEPQYSQSLSNHSAQASNVPGTDPGTSILDTNLVPDVLPTETQPNLFPNSTASNSQTFLTSASQISTPIIIVDPSPQDDQSPSTKSSWAHSYLKAESNARVPAPEGTATSTYDSFWSSHSGWTSSKSFRTSSVGSVLPDYSGPTDLQGSTEFVGGFGLFYSVDSDVPSKTGPTIKNGVT
ncbi:hypothetical protein BDQ17DRAFT_1541248 [Cyathus striatus]|nr:hypothetical protein BDQ17DRAFT_1541248 [Cyathus striatus]